MPGHSNNWNFSWTLPK